MPKVVDHTARRQELARAVWRVIRRHGVDGASVRAVAEESGWSVGSVRHYFSTQSELLAFTMGLVGERVAERVAAVDGEGPVVDGGDPRRTAERVLHQVLPLDDERRAEAEIWLAFTARALVDPDLRTRYDTAHTALQGLCRVAVDAVVDAANVDKDVDRALEAERLHALVDGLALHAVVRPDPLPPERMVAILAAHLGAIGS